MTKETLLQKFHGTTLKVLCIAECATPKASDTKSVRWLSASLTLASFLVFSLLIMAVPALAFAQGTDAQTQLTTQGNSALSWIWTAVYFIEVVAVLGAAVMASFGHMQWRTVGQVLIGAIVAGLCTAVVQALMGSSSKTSFT